jgi:hypothetical protein
MCRLKGHRPGERIIRNGGRAFARCRRCGADLVEIDGAWRAPPKGARIVWTPAGSKTADETSVEAEPGAPIADQRVGADRRAASERRKTKGPLPAFLRGKDRRSGQRDRRRAFGRRFRGE